MQELTIQINFFSLGKDEGTTRATVIRATTDSPMSPPPCGSTMSLAKQIAQKTATTTLYAPKSLLDIWCQRVTPRDRRPDFHGRANSDGPRAKLYPNLKENAQPGRGEPVIEA